MLPPWLCNVDVNIYLFQKYKIASFRILSSCLSSPGSINTSRPVIDSLFLLSNNWNILTHTSLTFVSGKKFIVSFAVSSFLFQKSIEIFKSNTIFNQIFGKMIVSMYLSYIVLVYYWYKFHHNFFIYFKSNVEWKSRDFRWWCDF